MRTLGFKQSKAVMTFRRGVTIHFFCNYTFPKGFPIWSLSNMIWGRLNFTLTQASLSNAFYFMSFFVKFMRIYIWVSDSCDIFSESSIVSSPDTVICRLHLNKPNLSVNSLNNSKIMSLSLCKNGKKKSFQFILYNQSYITTRNTK